LAFAGFAPILKELTFLGKAGDGVTLCCWYRLARRHLRSLGILAAVLAASTLISLIYPQPVEAAQHPLPWFVRLRDAVEIIDAVAVVIALVFGGIFLIAARMVAPPGAVTVDHLKSMPNLLSSNHFRYRVPSSQRELRAAVMIADNEFAAVARHPALFGANRYEMYTRWWQSQPNAFLILDRFDDVMGCWLPFALTIILPLTDEGEKLILSGLFRLEDFGKGPHVAEASTSFLIEAWIMRKRNPLVAILNPTVRARAEDFAKALLFVHLGCFHSGKVEDPAIVYVDSGTPRMKNICARLGFTGRYKSQDGAPFQRLTLPPAASVDDEVRSLQAHLFEHVQKARTWPLFRYS
jgi:hypothetical protein